MRMLSRLSGSAGRTSCAQAKVTVARVLVREAGAAGDEDVDADGVEPADAGDLHQPLALGAWEKQVLSARGFKRVGRHSEYAI